MSFPLRRRVTLSFVVISVAIFVLCSRFVISLPTYLEWNTAQFKARESARNIRWAVLNATPDQGDYQMTYRCTSPHMVALTFDDNPNDGLPDLLTVLGKYNATATFFPNAPYYFHQEHLDAHVRSIHQAGHQIGVHTWDHLDMDQIGTVAAQADIDKMNDWLYATLGKRSSFVRPPYGDCNESCVKALKKRDFKVVKWSLDLNDWRYPTDETVNSSLKILDDYMRSYNRTSKVHDMGPIVLVHSRIHPTIHITTPRILEDFTAYGFEFVSLAECLGYTKDEWYF